MGVSCLCYSFHRAPKGAKPEKVVWHEYRSLVFDIGGGSTEFVLSDESGVRIATSVKLGHIRLTERLLGNNTTSRKAKTPPPAKIEEVLLQIGELVSDSVCISMLWSLETQNNKKNDVIVRFCLFFLSPPLRHF